jgi:drug/metabolite transporter (DMT)-like permease
MKFLEKKGNKKKGNILGIILVFSACLIYSASFVLNKFFVVKIDPFIFTTMRAFLIGIVFLFISLMACKFRIKKFKKVSWWKLILVGIIGGGAPFLLFFLGLRETTAGRAAFLYNTLPLYAIILSAFFLKEKIKFKHTVVILSMIAGAFLIEFSNASLTMKLGDFLILSAAILWAVENTIIKKAGIDEESPAVLIFGRMFFGSIMLIAITYYLFGLEPLISLEKVQWGYIAVSSTLLCLYSLLWYHGTKYIESSNAATIMLASPILILIISSIFLKESPSIVQILGSAIIIAGAYIVVRNKNESRMIEN